MRAPYFGSGVLDIIYIPPLGEHRESNNDYHPLPVPRRRNQSDPACPGTGLFARSHCVSDLRHFKYDERIVFTAPVRVVFAEDTSRFSLLFHNENNFSKRMSVAVPGRLGLEIYVYIPFLEQPTTEDSQG